jgi:hypothetical protein
LRHDYNLDRCAEPSCRHSVVASDLWECRESRNQLISHGLLLLNYSLEPWQLRRIPSTADGFDEKNTGIHSTPLNIDVIALICQQHRLRRDDLEIVVDAALVPIGKELKRFLGRCRGFTLLLCLLLENAQCCKLVFYLLEGGKCRLPIRSYGTVIVCGCPL